MKYTSTIDIPTTRLVLGRKYRDRLRKHSSYLDTVDKSHFDMSFYAKDDYNNYLSPEELRQKIHSCGTVACSIGYTPFSLPGVTDYSLYNDIFKRPNKNGYDAITVSEDVFNLNVDEQPTVWYWLFGEMWDSIDNTPGGAASRIRFALKHGIPDYWNEDDPERIYTEFCSINVVDLYKGY